VISVLAHTGHWWHSVLYLAPVVVVGVVLAISERRAKRGSDVPPEH
jgi:hypothetical protein